MPGACNLSRAYFVVWEIMHLETLILSRQPSCGMGRIQRLNGAA